MTDQDVLSLLHSILDCQRQAREAGSPLVKRPALTYLRHDYRQLPEGIARRLTLLPPETLARIPSGGWTDQFQALLDELTEILASDEAIAQVTRAANVYRARLDMQPLPDKGQADQTTETGGDGLANADDTPEL